MPRDGRKEGSHVRMFVEALFLAALLGSTLLVSADAAPRRAREYDQPQRRESGGSWQCYPYCSGGTYEGRPLREWMKPDSW